MNMDCSEGVKRPQNLYFKRLFALWLLVSFLLLLAPLYKGYLHLTSPTSISPPYTELIQHRQLSFYVTPAQRERMEFCWTLFYGSVVSFAIWFCVLGYLLHVERRELTENGSD